MAKNLKLKAFNLKQYVVVENDRNRAVYNTTIKLGDLLNNTAFKINWWETEKRNTEKQGYQRKPDENRKKKILKYLFSKGVKNAVFPTNIVISSHKPIKFTKIDGNWGEIEITDYPLWIIDGQNRIEGFRYAADELDNNSLDDYELPVTILSDFDIYDELEQFYILNTTQKKVKTDLAQVLRKEIAKKVGLENYQEVYGDGWDLRALSVTELLTTKQESDMSNLWYGRIQFPNTKKSISIMVSQNSFVTSLKPLFKSGIMENGTSLDEAYKYIKNYWIALSQIFPDAFSRPKEYVIQKTPGIFSLHDLANTVFTQLLVEKKEITVENIKNVLIKAFSDEKHTNDYWRTDNYLGASMAGSMKGFKRIADELKENIQK